MSGDSDQVEVIEGDGEYFKGLLSLVPYLVPPETTQKRPLDPDVAEGPAKKKKKKQQQQKQKTEGKALKELMPQQNAAPQSQPMKAGQKRQAVEEASDDAEDLDTNFGIAPLPKKQKKGKSKPDSAQMLKPKQQKEEKAKKQKRERVAETMSAAINGTSHVVGTGAAVADKVELKQKLHAKIQEARAKKGLPTQVEKGEKTQQKNKKEKKKEKKKKKKEKKKEEKAKAAKQLQGNEEGQESKTGGAKAKAAPTAKKPLFNLQGSLLFNKISFDHSGDRGKAGRSELVGRDYKRILTKLEKRKEKVEKLREKDEGMARSLEDKMAWKDAVSKAAGVKVKDDESLVKRSLKRKMKIKEKKKKKWGDRQKTVRKNIEQKQAKRERNIEARKQGKQQKKYKKMVKKGRIVPGMDN